MDASLNREILRIALPGIIASITVPIVGMVDLAIAGHLPSGAALCIGGVTVGSMIFDILYWNFGFLRAGTGGMTAQAYGRGDMKAAMEILVRGVGVALLLSLLVIAVQWPFSRLMRLMVGCSREVWELALKYFLIRVWAAPATLSLMSFKGWFIGMQDSFSSMMTDLIVNVVNVAASLVLALGAGSWEGMGFPGIALGTVMAQYSGLLYALLKVLFSYRGVWKGFTLSDLRLSFRRSEMRSFLSFNGDLFLRSIGITAIYISYTMIASGYGDLMLACSAIMMKLLMLFSYFTDGFAYAGEALTGKYIGRADPVAVKRSVKYVFVWSMAIAILFIGIYQCLGVPLLRLLTSDDEVVLACRQFLPWLVLMPPLGCAAFTWDGIYEGATASRPIRDAMIAALLAFLGVWFVSRAVLAPTGALAIHLLLAAYFIHLLVRTVWLTLGWKKML